MVKDRLTDFLWASQTGTPHHHQHLHLVLLGRKTGLRSPLQTKTERDLKMIRRLWERKKEQEGKRDISAESCGYEILGGGIYTFKTKEISSPMLFIPMILWGFSLSLTCPLYFFFWISTIYSKLKIHIFPFLSLDLFFYIYSTNWRLVIISKKKLVIINYSSLSTIPKGIIVKWALDES